jgi:hypothetical protein
VQEVRGRSETPHQQHNTHFFMENGMRIMNWVKAFLYIRESSLKGVDFVSDRMSY